MESRDLIINQIPVRTWNHMRMNEAVLKDVQFQKEAVTKVSIHGKDHYEKSSSVDFNDIEGGCSKDLISALEEFSSNTLTFVSKESSDEADYIRLNVAVEDHEQTVQKIFLETKENASLTAYLELEGTDITSTAAVLTRLNIGKNSTLRLVVLYKNTESVSMIHDIGAQVEEGASFQLLQLMVGEGKQYHGCLVKLSGDESLCDIGIGYERSGKSLLDLNYIARHIGKNTHSDIKVAGALSKEAVKTFRGTLDFVKGARNSIGAETEDVFMIDEGCVNKTIPMILCGEEAVSGSHGASIGRPDDETVFYLMSRGMEEEEAIRMLSQAKLRTVLNRIAHSEIRSEYEEICGLESSSEDEQE